MIILEKLSYICFEMEKLVFAFLRGWKRISDSACLGSALSGAVLCQMPRQKAEERHVTCLAFNHFEEWA